MLFRATVEIKGGHQRALTSFDAFRESALPGTEHGVTMSNLSPADEANTYTVDVEIDAGTESEAMDAFDAMRAATVPAKHGITLYGLEAVEPAGPGFHA